MCNLAVNYIKVKPDVKVIIETALERNEKSIKEVIAVGAYQYISKPIRFENIKEIIQIIEKEQSLLEKKDENISEEVVHKIISEKKQDLQNENDNLEKNPLDTCSRRLVKIRQ